MRKIAQQIALFFPWSKKRKGLRHIFAYLLDMLTRSLSIIWCYWIVGYREKPPPFSFFFLFSPPFRWWMSQCKQWAGAALTPTPVWEAHSGPIHPSHFLFLCYLWSPRISLHRRPYLPSHLINHAIELNATRRKTGWQCERVVYLPPTFFFLLPPSPVFPTPLTSSLFLGVPRWTRHIHTYTGIFGNSDFFFGHSSTCKWCSRQTV